MSGTAPLRAGLLHPACPPSCHTWRFLSEEGIGQGALQKCHPGPRSHFLPEQRPEGNTVQKRCWWMDDGWMMDGEMTGNRSMGRRRGGQVARWHVGLQWASSVLYFLSAEHVTISTGFLDQVQTEKQIHLLGHLSIYLCLFQFFFFSVQVFQFFM